MKSLLIIVASACSLLTVVLANPVSDRQVTAQFQLSPDSEYTVATGECAGIEYTPRRGIFRILYACNYANQGRSCYCSSLLIVRMTNRIV